MSERFGEMKLQKAPKLQALPLLASRRLAGNEDNEGRA